MTMVEDTNDFGISGSASAKNYMKFAVSTDYPGDKTKIWCKLGFDNTKPFPFSDSQEAKLFEEKLTKNFGNKIFTVSRQKIDDGSESENVKKLAQFQRAKSTRGRGAATTRRFM